MYYCLPFHRSSLRNHAGALILSLIGGLAVVSYRGKKIRLGCRCNAREWSLIVWSLIAISRGLLYTIVPGGRDGAVLNYIGQLIPLSVYAVLWIAAGVWGVVEAWRHKRGTRPLMVLVSLFAFWGTAYAVSAVMDRTIGLVVTAWFFVALALLSGFLTRLDVLPKEPHAGPDGEV